ncbi:hypothetical protein DMC30DRAFT_260904 [Rhodotorula diobovata]|uniref:Uncharacterized protein n=1 Tax=Rhodotorula diobovata TaxID=5288 RepID=A0A5C5G6D6_9BASI|nr:hypothetical protein DMC30DRAFT_260904 [Rhodotorula diobovata]
MQWWEERERRVRSEMKASVLSSDICARSPSLSLHNAGRPPTTAAGAPTRATQARPPSPVDPGRAPRRVQPGHQGPRRQGHARVLPSPLGPRLPRPHPRVEASRRRHLLPGSPPRVGRPRTRSRLCLQGQPARRAPRRRPGTQGPRRAPSRAVPQGPRRRRHRPERDGPRPAHRNGPTALQARGPRIPQRRHARAHRSAGVHGAGPRGPERGHPRSLCRLARGAPKRGRRRAPLAAGAARARRRARCHPLRH